MELTVSLREISRHVISLIRDVSYVQEAEEFPRDRYEPFPQLGAKVSELAFEVEPKDAEFFGLDGSSKSLITPSGIISVATVAVSGVRSPLVGAFPSLNGFKGLNLRAPFVAVAPSITSFSPLTATTNDWVMVRSVDGTLFTASMGVQRIETELRAYLETEALSVIPGRAIIDGPLLPSFVDLPAEVRRSLVKARILRINKDSVGLVKRIDRSKMLVEALNPYASQFESRFGFKHSAYISDEPLVAWILKRFASPPYRPVAVGPVIYEPHGYRVYAYYLAIPLHPYIHKFSVFRVESLSRGEEFVREVASLPLGSSGVPFPVSYADKVAREVRGGIIRALTAYLESSGIPMSYAGKMSVTTA